MCCCIPLRRLSYFGAGLHLMMGLLYFYFLGCVIYTMYRVRDKDNYDERVTMGLLYVGYYAAFLPPGIFIFWGVHKKLRCFLVVPSILFFFIQIFGVTLEGIYKFRPQGFPEAMEKYNQEGLVLSRLQADYWMDMCLQLAITISYLSMLFFYYREIEPEDTTPVQSRYAQAYLQQQQQLMQQQQSGSGPQSSSPPVPCPMGPPVVPFRPVHHSLTNLTRAGERERGGGGGRDGILGGNGTPCPPPPLNLGALNLSLDQQHQLLKLQQHPLILQQLQQQIHHQQQQQLQQQLQQQQSHQYHDTHHIQNELEMQHRPQHHHHHHERGHHQQGGGSQSQQSSLHHQPSSHSHQPDQAPPPPPPLSLFHPYAQMMDPNKTPKF
ncbi:uncharacterized protein LOC110849094 [Folsomia candida]|uniref:Uncharacterized protein n=1 Tax=Folsomia candida TaxID=158441 RepID=A0A226EFF4_FOLCA|nr:uncharacterized protein LOC110849094 [Folsomia candida]OXA55531.1 hypothetical protein Fcan01_09537 [Folsomia candida]